MFFEKRSERLKIDKMNSSDRAEAIRRVELERDKINAEIENILKSYAKESGNRALKKRKKRKKEEFDMDFGIG